MVLDHTKVVYTAEDEQGFTFRQINDEDAAVEGFDSICGIAHRYGCQHFFQF